MSLDKNNPRWLRRQNKNPDILISRRIQFISIESQPGGVPSAETRKAKPQIKVMCGQAFINGQLYCSTGVPDAG